MAMIGSALGDAMKSKVDAYIATLTDPNDLNRDTLFQEMGEAIVDYITTNAVISTSVTVTSVTGVTTGLGVSGPGTGTGTGTIA
jgi:hypothetical protein